MIKISDRMRKEMISVITRLRPDIFSTPESANRLINDALDHLERSLEQGHEHASYGTGGFTFQAEQSESFVTVELMLHLVSAYDENENDDHDYDGYIWFGNSAQGPLRPAP